MTLAVGSERVTASTATRARTGPACAKACSSSPTAKLVDNAGMLTGVASVAANTSCRSGCPSLKTRTAA